MFDQIPLYRALYITVYTEQRGYPPPPREATPFFLCASFISRLIGSSLRCAYSKHVVLWCFIGI